MHNKHPHSIHLVHTSDCDIMGHLNNTQYLTYFINAREAHLLQAYNMKLSDYFAQGIGWVIGNHEIYYVRPVKHNEHVRITTALIQMSDAHLLVESRMTDEHGLSLKSILWTRYVPVNIQTGRKEKHPEAFMEFAKGILFDEVVVEDGLPKRLNNLLSKRNSP